MRKRERKNKEELTTGFRRPWKNWIDTQCKKTDAFLKKNNRKKAYQLVKDLTSETQGRSIALQDKSAKCFAEEQEIVSRLTEYCSEI